MNPSDATIHQTLHGYQDGHSLLAASLDLDSESAGTMLVMSDLAPRGPVRSSGWLVGYPLPRAKRYVLARTWPAPEMPRPGCVWTHSILIDRSYLRSSPGLSHLGALFRRPAHDFPDFAVPLDDVTTIAPIALTSHLYSPAREILKELYSSNREVTKQVSRDADAKKLLFAFWEQQWPALREQFRWTTLDTQPSPEVPKFDLAVIPNPERIELEEYAASVGRRQGWIVAALADLRRGGGQLRSELRHFSTDVSSGRRAFSLLVSTCLLVERSVVRTSDAEALISLIGRRLRPDEGATARAAILAALLRNPSYLNEESLNFALSLVPKVGDREASEIAMIAWQINKSAFWQQLPTTPAGSRAVDDLISKLPISELIDAVAENEAPARAVVEQRPEILAEAKLWQSADAIRQELFQFTKDNPSQLAHALMGAFAAQDITLARDLLPTSSTAPMFATYMAWERGNGAPNTQRQGFPRAWLVAAASDENAARDYLSGDFRLRPSVVVLARSLDPNSFPPEYDADDLWAESWETSAGSPVPDDIEFISAFFLFRACRFNSRRRAERFAATVQNVLGAFERGMRDAGARAFVSDYFSQYGVFSLLERDVTRVYRGLARLVGRYQVPIALFVATGRVQYVEELVDQLRWHAEGRDVLKIARRELERSKAPKRRIKIVESALR